MKNKIDFVMIWVNGGDKAWQAEKQKYSSDIQESSDDCEARYRDWNNLKYWFRAVEKYAPWVNKVYFITCGHVPEWLNLHAPKLVHVKHSEYMDSAYVPTFSSHPIELNIHRIKGISEHIVYFNDDMFLTQPVKPELFFRNGVPVHPARLHGVLPRNDGGIMPYIYLNMITVINKHFNMRKDLKKNWKNWFLPWKVGFKTAVENCYNYSFEQYPGFANEHLPVPILKSTIETVWKEEFDLLNETSMHKFRDMRDVSQYLFRYWQLASGNFVPEKAKIFGLRLNIRENTEPITQAIRQNKYKMICLNDMDFVKTPEKFAKARDEIISAFESILPEKSSFEK